MSSLTHIALFAGIDSFGRGFERSGIQTIACVEWDKTCQSVLRRHDPDALLLADVCEAGKHNLPTADIISFGSPCQDFSVAGKRKGLAGERSGLLREALRIVGELKPTFALWENVPGALSSHAGRDFASILAAFRELGARDIAWRVLDAQYCGVAQQRRRVLLVADFGGERAGEVLFESDRVSWHPPAHEKAWQRITGTIADSSGKRGWSSAVDCCMWTEEAIASGEEGAMQEAPRDAGSLGSHHGRHDLDSQGAYIAERSLSDGMNDRAHTLTARHNPAGASSATKVAEIAPAVAGSLTARYGKGAPTTADDALIATFQETGQSKWHESPVGATIRTPGGGGSLHANVVAHALTSEGADASEDGTGRGTPLVSVACHGAHWRVRRLTPRECERLQGLEDDYTRWRDDGSEISDSARYRMLGNAGAVPVFAWIGKRIAAVEREEVAS